MEPEGLPLKVSRRRVLQSAAAGIPGCCIAPPWAAQIRAAKEGTVRDRFWVFGCPPNSDWSYFKRRSLMSPVESAFYLDVPNVIMVQVRPSPNYTRFEPPFDQYAVALRPMKRVQWSVVGAGGFTSSAETRQALELVKKTPNFVGIYLDDFFYTREKEGKRAFLSVGELDQIRQELKASGKKLDINATFYTTLLDLPLADYIELIDQLTLWTWKPADLANLEANMAKLDKVAPRARKWLGCYIVDYTERKSWPVDGMRYQCETGLRWLREKRIDEIVFLGNTAMDLGFEAVEWTREWIRKVGDARL
jgi:hypothetical protein